VIYLFILVILALITLLYMSFEASFVELTRVKFTENQNCLKVLHLSDIHIPLLKVNPKKVKKLIDLEKPDFIVITGDYIIKPTQIHEFLKFIKSIKGNNKMLICYGNHDHKAFKYSPKELDQFSKNLEDIGITVLRNNSVCFEKASRKYNIIGIEDLRYNNNVTQALATCCENSSANIVITHNPDIVLELPNNKVDYAFCGHFHGGQIWAPFNIEFKLLRSEKLCKMGIRRGLHNINGINLYINRGLGNVFIPLRLFSRPEITVYYIP